MGDHYFRSNGTERRREQFYKFLKEDKFVDVTLISEDGMEVKAHRMILSSATEFFDNIFQKCKNTENFVIFLYGVKFLQLKGIIEFIYLGETTVEEKNLNTFLQISKLLKIEDMKKIEPDPVASFSENKSVIKRNSEKLNAIKIKPKYRIILMKNLSKKPMRDTLTKWIYQQGIHLIHHRKLQRIVRHRHQQAA